MTRSLQINYETRLLLVDDAFFEKHISHFKLQKQPDDPQDMRFVILDDIKVAKLIRATKNSRNAISITAPRLTAFNAQNAYSYIQRQVSYVHKITKVKHDAGFKYDPQLKVAEPGVTMEVYGVISADRRYITGHFRSIIRHVSKPVRVAFDDGPADQKLYTEEVDIDSWQRRITVSVPDLATLLITGKQKIRVPQLPDGFGNSEKFEKPMRVVVLIKPTIILMTKEKAMNFPGLDKVPR
jgi:hypothetical protein